MTRPASSGDDSVDRADRWAEPDFCVEATMTDFGKLTMSVQGELELSTAGSLLDELAEWLGIRECIVELGACDFIDSAGIGALVECRHQIGPEASLRLVGLAPHVERILRHVGLDQIASLEPASRETLNEPDRD